MSLRSNVALVRFSGSRLHQSWLRGRLAGLGRFLVATASRATERSAAGSGQAIIGFNARTTPANTRFAT